MKEKNPTQIPSPTLKIPKRLNPKPNTIPSSSPPQNPKVEIVNFLDRPPLYNTGI
jgi:hypothetical protein